MYKKIFTSLALTIILGLSINVIQSSEVLATAPVDVLNGTCVTNADGTKTCNSPCQNTLASASSSCQDNSTAATSNPIYGPNGILTVATQIIAWVVGIVSVAIILISSLRLINSGGDSNTVNSARSAILYALIGVAIAVAAQVIVVFILGKV